MDILKTLLVYMVMVANGAVAASGATPIPYEALNTPTPYVTPAPTPAPTQEPTTAPALAPDVPTATPRLYLLTKGSSGTSVRNLQARLIELGYLTGEADGIYGKATETAVREFQLRNGLKVDGKAGLQTQEKLFYAQDVVPAK